MPVPTEVPGPSQHDFGSASAEAAEIPAQPAATKEGNGTDQTRAEAARIMQRQKELMKDQEYRQARLAQLRIRMPQNYPFIAEELGLSPEEADRLFDLLAANELEMSEASLLTGNMNGVQPDPAVLEDAGRRVQELQRTHEQALVDLLGARYPQWQEYMETRGMRRTVVSLGRVLDGAGVPLTPEQSRPLTTAYIAEQKRQREETQRLMQNLRAAGSVDQGRAAEERSRIAAQSNQRLIQAVRPHLDARQLDALQAALDQMLAVNRRASEQVRQQRGREASVSTP